MQQCRTAGSVRGSWRSALYEEKLDLEFFGDFSARSCHSPSPFVILGYTAWCSPDRVLGFVASIAARSTIRNVSTSISLASRLEAMEPTNAIGDIHGDSLSAVHVTSASTENSPQFVSNAPFSRAAATESVVVPSAFAPSQEELDAMTRQLIDEARSALQSSSAQKRKQPASEPDPEDLPPGAKRARLNATSACVAVAGTASAASTQAVSLSEIATSVSATAKLDAAVSVIAPAVVTLPGAGSGSGWATENKLNFSSPGRRQSAPLFAPPPIALKVTGQIKMTSGMPPVRELSASFSVPATLLPEPTAAHAVQAFKPVLAVPVAAASAFAEPAQPRASARFSIAAAVAAAAAAQDSGPTASLTTDLDCIVGIAKYHNVNKNRSQQQVWHALSCSANAVGELGLKQFAVSLAGFCGSAVAAGDHASRARTGQGCAHSESGGNGRARRHALVTKQGCQMRFVSQPTFALAIWQAQQRLQGRLH